MATSARGTKKGTATNGVAPDRPTVDVQQMAERFMARFRGLERFHGLSKLVGTARPGEKQETVSDAVHEPVTTELWAQHLFGVYGVGQTPIKDDGTCVFGCIDIDVYEGLDLMDLATKIDVMRLPLVVTRSKSGGAQCYLFLSEPTRADLVRGKLMQWQVALGFSKSETYPKQTKLASVRDYGSWLNMPYFGALSLDGTTRYAVLQSGDHLDAAAFLDHADAVAVSAETLADIEAPLDASIRDLLLEAPPCLQSLAVRGHIGKGSGNNGLFDIGVYLRKRFPDDWQAKIDEYNPRFLDPPKPSSEVQNITKSLGKKGYFYRCTEDPIVQACNKTICRTRKYGIGQGTDDPGVELGPLLKYDSGPGDPPIWLWDVNGKRIQLTTLELMSQPLFQRRCVEETNIMPSPVKAARWAEIVRQKLAEAEVIQAPSEVTKAGMIRLYLESFLTRSPRLGTEFSEIVTRRVPVVKDKLVWFRPTEFHAWLQRDVKYSVEMRELYFVLRQLGVESKQQRCGQSVVKLWSLPVFDALFAADGAPEPAVTGEDI
jgi:hypothetical protein